MKGNKDPEKREQIWLSIERKYKGLITKHGLNRAILEKWEQYFESFKRVVQEKQEFMKDWSLYQQSFMYANMGINLTEIFGHDDFDQSLLTFMFFESSELELKDIYMRFKMKSFLEKPGKKHEKDALIRQNPGYSFQLDYHEIEDQLLADLKRIYINHASNQISGRTDLRILPGMINRLNEVITQKVLSRGDHKFLGGLDTHPNAVSTKMTVVSSASTEVASGSLVERGFAQVNKRGIDPNHQNMGDLLLVFNDHVEHLVKVSKEAADMIDAINKGDAESITKRAGSLSNLVLGQLTSESPMILMAMAQYVDSFRINVVMADGQLRPTFFNVNESSGATPQELEMFRSLSALFPGEEENVAKVYGTIAKMLAWGIGDLLPQLSRYLPPMHLTTKNLDEHMRKVEKSISEFRSSAEYAHLSTFERAKREVEITKTYFKKNTNREVTTTYYDEYARALLAKTNPLLFLLWGSQLQESKVQHELFACGFDLNETKQPEGMAKLLEEFRRAFGSEIEGITDPLMVLYLYQQEVNCLSEGMTEEILEQRKKGRWPMIYRLIQLFPGLGLAERNSWRDDAVQVNKLLALYLNTVPGVKEGELSRSENERRCIRNNPSHFNPYDLIDLALQIGPRTALLVTSKLDTDPEFNKFMKFKYSDEATRKKEIKKLKDYVFNVTYEMFPSLYFMRPDIRRFTSISDKFFVDEWRTEIAAHLKTDDPQSVFNLFLPPEENQELYITSMGESWSGLTRTEINSRIVQQNMLEGLLVLEKFVMNDRNMRGLDFESARDPSDKNRRTLRSTLFELLRSTDELILGGLNTERVNIKNPQGELEIKYKQLLEEETSYRTLVKFLELAASQHGLRITKQNELRVVNEYAKHLIALLYKDDKGYGRDLNKAQRGLFDQCLHHNVGAITREGVEEKVDMITLMRNLEDRKMCGPVFDLYAENLSLKNPDLYNPQLTGSPDAGKSLDIRMYGDFNSLLKELDQFKEAMVIIGEATKTLPGKEFEAAEDKYLGKALEVVNTVYSYNPEAKKYQIGAIMVELWILMGRVPPKFGADYRFGGELAHLLASGKSLAEIANSFGSSGLASGFRLDMPAIVNFIAKAQKKGLLPPNKEGTDATVIKEPLRNNGKLKKQFDKIDVEFDRLNRLRIANQEELKRTLREQARAEGRTINEAELDRQVEGKGLSWLEGIRLRMCEAGKSFGLMNPFGLQINYKKNAFEWNAARMLEANGINRFKYLAQFGWYFLVFTALITFLAVQQGFGELETKK